MKLMMLQLIAYSFFGFALGYLVGRIGHYYINDWVGNPPWLPHHWIYGAILIPVSSYFVAGVLSLLILFFGVGHFVSDLKDFLCLRFFRPDEDGPKRFFHID